MAMCEKCVHQFMLSEWQRLMIVYQMKSSGQINRRQIGGLSGAK